MNTTDPFVITISREMGSGGRTIGQKLAARLGVRYSDKNLIQDLRRKFNLTTCEIEQIKAKKRGWLTDLLETVAPVPRRDSFIGFEPVRGKLWNVEVSQQEVFDAEVEILRGIAAEGSCVIAGRSGFFALKDHPNKLDVFIRAPREKRIERIMKKQGLGEEEAARVMDSVDKSREEFVKRFAGTSRYDARNYDLVLNVGGLSDDEAVECILDYIRRSAEK